MVRTNQPGQEDLFGTGTDQWRHKVAVLKRAQWQIVLH